MKYLPFRKWNRYFFATLSALTALLLTGCSFTDRMSTFDPKGPVARMQLDVFLITLAVTGFLFVAVSGALAIAMWKFRERKNDPRTELPDQSHGNPLVEIGLIGFSVLCLVIIAVPTLRGIWMMEDVEEAIQYAKTDEIIEVNVIGYQWWWAFEYPDLGITTANELIIPKDTVIKLNLRAFDVIHSFWLPKLAGKKDLMPGQKNVMWILGEEEGHYYGQCAEYCGEAHAYMLFRTEVLSQEGYEAWVEHQKSQAKPPRGENWNEFIQMAASDLDSLKDDPIAHGAGLFMTTAACTQCHAVDGSIAQGLKGPNLTHVGSRKSLGAGMLENRPLEHEYSADVETIDPDVQLENLHHWIYRSQDVKPGNLMWKAVENVKKSENNPDGLTEEDFRHIAMWLQSLK